MLSSCLSKVNFFAVARRFHSCATSKRKRLRLDSGEKDETEDAQNYMFPYDISDEGESDSIELSTAQLAQGRNGEVSSVCLPTVHTPKALDNAVQAVISRHNKKQLMKDGEALKQYLSNRIPVGCEWKVESKKQDIAGRIKPVHRCSESNLGQFFFVLIVISLTVFATTN